MTNVPGLLLKGSRITFAHPFPDLYGADQVFLDVLDGVLGAGAEVLVVVPADGPLLELLRTRGIRYEIASFPVLRKALLRPVPFAWLLISTPVHTARLIRILRREESDIVFANTITVPHWLLAARLAKVGSVCHVHELEEQMRNFVSRVLLSPLLIATSVLSNSKATSRWLHRNWRSVGRKTRLVYNGVRFLQMAGRSPRRSLSSPLKVVLVGRLSPRKGQEVAIAAVSRLVESGYDCRLTLVGSVFPGYEWYQAKLEQQIRDLSLENKVVMVGFVPDPASEYLKSDLALVPSLVEPFGLVAAEALACGVPVIASEIGGLPEIVIPGKTGLLVPAGDSDALYREMRRFINEPRTLQALAGHGQEMVHRMFSVSRMKAEINIELLRCLQMKGLLKSKGASFEQTGA